MLKTLFQHSGWKVLFWAFLGWLAASIPEWAGMIVLPEPWDGIVTGALSFVAATIRLLIAHYREPTVDATKLPKTFVEEHATPAEVKTIEAAKERK